MQDSGRVRRPNCHLQSHLSHTEVIVSFSCYCFIPAPHLPPHLHGLPAQDLYLSYRSTFKKVLQLKLFPPVPQMNISGFCCVEHFLCKVWFYYACDHRRDLSLNFSQKEVSQFGWRKNFRLDYIIQSFHQHL